MSGDSKHIFKSRVKRGFLGVGLLLAFAFFQNCSAANSDAASTSDDDSDSSTTTTSEYSSPSLISSVSSPTVTEGNTATITIYMVSTSSSNRTFQYQTVDATAYSGYNYEEASGTVTVAAYSSTATISIPTTSNGSSDGTVAFYVQIGQLDIETPVTIESTVKILDIDSSSTSAMSVGLYHSCLIDSDSSLSCWGYNNKGQLGDGSTSNSSSSISVSGMSSNVTSVSAGAYHTCAVVNSALKCWGQNTNGQLGTDPDLPLPTMFATKLNPTKEGEIVRVIMQYKTDMITIDFQTSVDKLATVNGMALTAEDLQSFQELYKKLEAPSMGLKEIAYLSSERRSRTRSSAWQFFWYLMVPSSIASAQIACQVQTGAICWDEIKGSPQEKRQKLSAIVDSKSLSAKDLKEIESQLARNVRECQSSDCPENRAWSERQTLIHSLLEKSPPKAEARLQSKGPGEEKSFWDENKSWLKPLAFVSAGILVLWKTCWLNIKILGCGKSSSSSSSSGLPGSNPTNPVNTGVGTQ